MSQDKDQTVQDGKPPMKPGRRRGLPQKRRYDTRSSRQERYMRLRSCTSSEEVEELNIQMQWSGEFSTFPGSYSENDSSDSQEMVSNVAASSSRQFQTSDVEGAQVASEDNSFGTSTVASSSHQFQLSDVDGMQVALEEDGNADEYNFMTVQEDAPMDACPYKMNFEQPLNQSASDYVVERRAEQARRERMELFMYSLAAANEDEVYEIEDIRQVLETELINQGVESLVITPDLTINYNRRSTVTTERGREDIVLVENTRMIPDDIIPDDEAVIVNGLPLPHLQPPSSNLEVSFNSCRNEEEEVGPCQLCVHADISFQFGIRHRSEAIRHAMLHGMEIPVRPSVRFEDTFSPDVTLERSSYDREFNFLPTANSFEEAVNIIMADDSPLPAPRLDRDDIMGNVIAMIRSSPINDLLWFYACILLTDFSVKGNTIRHVYHCNGR